MCPCIACLSQGNDSQLMGMLFRRSKPASCLLAVCVTACSAMYNVDSAVRPCGRADEVICSADEPVVRRVMEITGAPCAGQ